MHSNYGRETIQRIILAVAECNSVRGTARILSLDKDDLPSAPEAGKPATFRSIKMNGQAMEFTEGFTDLHTVSYERILAGEGFDLEDSKPAADIVASIRRSKPSGLRGDYHPLLKRWR